MLCPEVVGRDREQALLDGRVEDLAEGRGGLLVLVGEAGVGKSRLARHLVDQAGDRDVAVLMGRAIPGSSPLPYRPLTEAFLGAFRSSAPLDHPSLAGFEAHLGRLVPAWQRGSPSAPESPLLLGEAVVRLLALHGDGRGSVLVLEDVHWADPETIEVLDHLADALVSEPVLCLCTSRPGGAAHELTDRLARRDPGAVVPVGPLPEPQIDRMVGACLDVHDAPSQVVDFVQRHSDGTPFLVEELLAGLVVTGELRHEDGRWTSAATLTPTVPASLRESIQRRLATLSPTARRVVGAAALLGRGFDWELLPGIAEVDGKDVVDGLRAAVDEQLVEVDGSGFRFRHALTREAVLHDLLPPERRDMASRAWPAHERAHPGLPGPTLQQAADLAEAAGALAAAARHLVESSRRALQHGAFATAEAAARRARHLAGDDAAAAFDADEVLVQVLLGAGKPGEALTTGRALAARPEWAAAPSTRRADLLVLTGRAALAAGDVTAAAEATGAARTTAGEDPDPALAARLDVLRAEVALEEADFAAAGRLARAAVEAAVATGQARAECEALLVLGRVIRTVDGVPVSLATFERAGAVAAGAGLADLHLRAQQEQALVVWTRGELQPLHDVRELAVRYGALITVAVMDLSLADVALSGYDRELCFSAATACVEASRRYGLATEPVANLWLAGAHALAAHRVAMQEAIDAALVPDPDDPRILADLYGRVLPTAAFVDDDLDRLPDLADTMMEHVRVASAARSVYPGRVLWALLHTIDDDDLGAAARAEFAESTQRIGLVVYDTWTDVLEAVALGREGDVEGANARGTAAYERLTVHPMSQGSTRSHAILVARAALRDGWGEPVRWLRESEAFFATRGYDRLARRCRLLLGEAGVPVPRRGRGSSEVPVALRALGVTSREVDVLKLVTAGRTNKQIADDLVLSPKTVERHLSSLFTRLGVANRRELGDLGRSHLGDDAS